MRFFAYLSEKRTRTLDMLIKFFYIWHNLDAGWSSW